MIVNVEWGGIYHYEPPTESDSPQAAVFVTSGSEQSGIRPWVVVSRDGANKGKPTAVGVPLSRKITKANSYRILIPKAELISESSYEFADSVALCDHIRVLDLKMITKKLGRMSDTGVRAVGGGLLNLFDLR